MFTFSLLLFALAHVASAGPPAACTFAATDENGKIYHYDMTSIWSAQGYIQGAEPAANSQFAIKLCGNAAAAFGCTSETPVCQKDNGGAANSCGQLSSWTLSPYEDPSTLQKMPAGGVIATITGGSACPERARQTVLYLKCNPSAPAVPTSTVQISEQQMCIYTGTIESSAFCPSTPQPTPAPTPLSTCFKYSSCNTCASSPGCSWCYDRGLCVDGASAACAKCANFISTSRFCSNSTK